MIKKLQSRFIRIAVIVLSAAILTAVAVVNGANYLMVRGEMEETLSLIVQNQRGVPATGDGVPASGERTEERTEQNGGGFGRFQRRRMVLSESVYVTVLVRKDGAASVLGNTRAPETDLSGLQAVAQSAVSGGRQKGWSGDYLYVISEGGQNGEKLVVFLNCETRMSSLRSLLLLSLAVCAGCILVSWLLVRMASRKAIAPIIRNMEQQKRFITDASHELKTPLTVISTNMDLLSMEVADNQWVNSTRKQVAGMRRLVDEMVYLSRMEEENAPLQGAQTDFTALLKDVADPFEAMAEFNGKTFTVFAQDDLALVCDEEAVRRLLSTLCDNAVKYCTEGGAIHLSAQQEGRHVLVILKNTVEQPLTPEQCGHLFDRFYRTDRSRARDDRKSGYGIGLAIAQAIAEKHGGEIKAAMEGDSTLCFRCRLEGLGTVSKWRQSQ